MLDITIISGFLGAGKTTLINQLLRDGVFPRNTLLVENEFGEIGVDAALLEKSYPVLELGSGCICCSIGADFVEQVCRLVTQHQPEALLIEPSGCADLGEFVKQCRQVCHRTGGVIRRVITVVNGEAVLAQLELGGPFFRNQLAEAPFLAISCMDAVEPQERQMILEELGILNQNAPICMLPMDSAQLLFRSAESYRTFNENRDNPRGVLLRKMGLQMQSVSIHPGRISPERAEAFLASAARGDYGTILRIKGFLDLEGVGTGYLEYIPGKTPSITHREDSATSGLVIIGRNLDVQVLSRVLDGTFHRGRPLR